MPTRCNNASLQVVAAVRGELVSVFDGVTRYQVGRWSTSRRGALGWPPLDTCYYAFDSPAAATHVPFPGNSRCLSAPRVLIRVRPSYLACLHSMWCA